MKCRYWAEWVAEILPPRPGREWNPDTDIRYERSGPYADRAHAASIAGDRDLDHEGIVTEERLTRDHAGPFWTESDRWPAYEVST